MSSKKEGQKGLCRGGPAGRREVKPRVALDYDTIGGAGGLASGGRGSKARQKKAPLDQDVLTTVYKSAGIGDSSEPASFFVFNGANGPISGTWAPNECPGDPSVVKMPEENAAVVPLKLTYKNDHTNEYDEI